MPSVRCKGCGATTNTAVSDAWVGPDYGEANKCYAKWDGEKWVEGCGFKDADGLTKRLIGPMLGKSKPVTEGGRVR